MTDALRHPASTDPTRRTLLGAGLSTGLVLAAGGLAAGSPSPALAQRGGPATVPVAELMKAGDLPDIFVGKADAPITIVEYASMTCPHCAQFHNTVYPQLKTKYIDSGQARFVFREFPLDDLAMGASMLARCAGGEGPAAMISELFKTQQKWAFGAGNPVPRLFELARQAGFTQARFDTCLTDQKLLDQISAVRKTAGEKFGVNSTPTFFVNGTRLNGVTLADFDKAIAPLLKS